MWTAIKSFMNGLYALAILALIITSYIVILAMGRWLVDIMVQSLVGWEVK